MSRFKKYIGITIFSLFIYLSFLFDVQILIALVDISLFFIVIIAVISLLIPAKYIRMTEADFESKPLTVYRAIMIPGSLLLSNMVPLAAFYFIMLFLIDAKLNKLKSKEGK